MNKIKWSKQSDPATWGDKDNTRHLRCPKCGKEDDTHWSMICGPCDVIMIETDVLPAENSAVEKRSPTIIFKGSGWTEKGDRK